MSDFSRDPYNNIIQEGLKGDIAFCFNNQRFRAALILIYSAIDSMASLTMPAEQVEVQRKDFIAWADRYIHLADSNAPTGVELYGARCALLHGYGIESRLSRTGDARRVFYVDNCWPAIRHDPSVDPSMVGVSLTALKDAVLAGIDRCMIEIHANPSEYPKTDDRLDWMFMCRPFDES